VVLMQLLQRRFWRSGAASGYRAMMAGAGRDMMRLMGRMYSAARACRLSLLKLVYKSFVLSPVVLFRFFVVFFD
jgi:hypothetical protein